MSVAIYPTITPSIQKKTWVIMKKLRSPEAKSNPPIPNPRPNNIEPIIVLLAIVGVSS